MSCAAVNEIWVPLQLIIFFCLFILLMYMYLCMKYMKTFVVKVHSLIDSFIYSVLIYLIFQEWLFFGIAFSEQNSSMRAFVKGRIWLQVNKQQQLATNVARQSLGRGKVDGERRCHLFIVSRSLRVIFGNTHLSEHPLNTLIIEYF